MTLCSRKTGYDKLCDSILAPGFYHIQLYNRFYHSAAPTVLARVKKLEKDRVIKFYSATLDHEKLGYDLTAIIEVTSVKGKVAEVEKHIAKFPNVCAVYDIGG